MNKKTVKYTLRVLCGLLMLWVTVGVVDLFKVKAFEKPLFTLKVDSADEEGYGMYYGLGYAFKIKGNFLPEDEFPGVTHYQYYLFNHLVLEGVRD